MAHGREQRRAHPVALRERFCLSGLVLSRSRSSAAPAWAANPSSSRAVTGPGLPRDEQGHRVADRDPAGHRVGGADPLTATLTQWPPDRSASSARPPQALVR